MGQFEVVRSTTVAADSARVHALINDLRAWRAWSPWERADPRTERVYAGSDAGVGACYAWTGGRKVGAGSMQITSSTLRQVELVLRFLKPFPGTHEVWFELLPIADSTVVTWRLRGRTTGLTALLGPVLSRERLLGRDFDRGLARLKAAAED